jgi:RHS repeat-associated protein
MQLGSSTTQIPDGLLAAMTLLSEKPHQGVPSWNLAPHQGIDERNSTAALGLRASEHLNRVWPRYTGKERDTESGNDYFGARYYNSATGRFLSPDWSAKVQPVPYAKLGNPQTLNLYAYVGNNPLSRTDPTGHYVVSCGSDVKGCDKQMKSFNDSISAGLKSKDQSVVQAARAYGALGEKNGVNVSIVNTVDPKNKDVTGNTGALAGTGGLQATADGKGFMQATQVNIQAGLSANQLSDTAVHEGQHVADRENFVTALGVDPTGQLVQGLNITNRMSEVNAYGVENDNRAQRGDPARDVSDVLSHAPYSTNPNINKPIFPDFPSPY